MTPLFSVIIVNWNGRALLAECLAALERQTFREFEVVVVDNGSTDDSLAFIETCHPNVTCLPQVQNLGFAAANNIGAQAATGHWLVLLNNDAFPEPDWLERLAEIASARPEFSGFGSCQLQAFAENLLDGAGDAYHAFGIPWREGLGQPVGAPWDEAREILSPCAAAAAYRRDAFWEVGGFDEAYFCYMEDMDLALRMQLRDHRFLYVPGAIIRHVGSATQGRESDFARYHGHRNLVWTFVKNMPSALFWRNLPGHILLNVWSLARFTLRGQGGPIWRAKWDALRGLARVWRQRQAIQARRTTSPERLARLMTHGVGTLLRESKARPQ